jgi:hypothetical protein
MGKRFFLSKSVLSGIQGIGLFVIPFLYGVIYTLSITKAPAFIIMMLLSLLSIKMICILLAGLLINRLIHGAIIIMETRNFKSVQIRSTGTVVSKEPVSLKTYRTYLLLPGLLMGILPNILFLIFGNFMLSLFGIFFTIDMLVNFIYLWMTRSLKNGMVLMKPEQCGFVFIDKLKK